LTSREKTASWRRSWPTRSSRELPSQLLAKYQQLVADLLTANPRVTFIVPPINPDLFTGTVLYIGTKRLPGDPAGGAFFGGRFPDTPGPGDTTFFTGEAIVDFYAGDLTVGAETSTPACVPPPAAVTRTTSVASETNSPWSGADLTWAGQSD
jgi:hypothetical protein